MGMNAKRSRDRFFKPGLASSSLAIPTSFCGGRSLDGEARDCGSRLRGFDSRRSPLFEIFERFEIFEMFEMFEILLQDGVTGSTPVSETGESRFDSLSCSHFLPGSECDPPRRKASSDKGWPCPKPASDSRIISD